MTEKAKLERIRMLKDRQTGALAAITKCHNELANLMADDENLHNVKFALEKLHKLYQSYQEIHIEYRESLNPEADVEKEIKSFEDRQNSGLDFKERVTDWITRAELAIGDKLSSASWISGSQKSYKSRHSQSTKSTRSSVSARAREKAKIAELEIEKSLLKRKQDIKLQEDELRIEAELAKAKAREKIFGEDENEPVNKLDSLVNSTYQRLENQPVAASERNVSKSLFNTRTPPSAARETETDFPCSDHLITTDTLLAALSLPQPEVPKFNGDLTTYKTFMTAFDARVASRAASNSDRLYFLEQHLEGEPKEIISGCFHLDPENGYSEARNLLDKEYGDPYKVSMIYLSKINDWQIIKQDDYVGLKRLSLFLTKCCHAMKCLSHLNVLDHPQNLLSVVQKLPFYLQNKWREYVGKMRQTHQKLMQFQDLAEFVASASDTANDPVYGKAAMSRASNQLAINLR
jgi:hypothetical protein